jgi:LacI family gluconate utilization system Gnt-I transcriptional repressor
MLRRKPAAIILTGGSHTRRARQLLETASIPVIGTWDLPEAPIGHVVGFSSAGAVHGLFDHCVSRGLTRIAFLGGDSDRDSRGSDRRAGFITAMKAHGIDPTRLVPCGAPPISMREGAEAMKWLLANLPDRILDGFQEGPARIEIWPEILIRDSGGLCPVDTQRLR